MVDISKEGQDKISEEIELLSNLMEVTSSLKDNVTKDYTLAYLSKDEKEYITENYQNAEFAKELIERFGKKGFCYKFDDKIGDWVRDEERNPRKVFLKDDEQELLMLMAKRIFTFFMISSHMIAILNRNKTDNFLVKLLGKHEDKEEAVTYGADDRSMIQKLKDKLTGEEDVESND